jgi:hypothetical protein
MKQLFLTAFAVSQISFAYSQTVDTAKVPLVNISGSADVYYKYNFNGNSTDNKTSFTNAHNSFELGMFSLKAEHTFNKGSIVADLGFGRRAAEFSYNDHPGDKGSMEMAVKQLYLGYQVLDKLKISMGSFATHIGYELVDAYQNKNYSMSYMFSNGPFFNTGVKAEVTISAHLSAMVGIFNPTDFKSASWSNGKYIGAQVAYSANTTPLKLYLNYLEGRDTAGVQNHQVDFVALYQVNDVVSFGYNGTVSSYLNTREKELADNTAKWWGSALYMNIDFTPKVGVSLRGEYFDDADGLKTFAGTGGGHVMAGTVSLNYKVGNLTIVPEFRLDKASRNIFNNNDGAPVSTSPNVLVAATYHF